MVGENAAVGEFGVRLFWWALALLIFGGGYYYFSIARYAPKPGLWEVRVEDPETTSEGLTNDEKSEFRESLLEDFGIDDTPDTRKECLSASAIRGLKQLGSQAVPSGFDANECIRNGSAGLGKIGASGQCRKTDGSIEMNYSATGQTAPDRLSLDVTLDYRFAENEQRRKAGMTLRYRARRVGDCGARGESPADVTAN